ncbi:MAG: hypothetical protein ACXVHS_04520 [Methanobacterium sp.]
MLKNNRNFPVSLRKRKSIINLEGLNLQSFLTIGIVLMVLLISILCTAASPNSNMLIGV